MQIKRQFTPGPWVAGDNESVRSIWTSTKDRRAPVEVGTSLEGNEALGTAHGSILPPNSHNLSNLPSYEQARFNALLMAAAPELLDALILAHSQETDAATKTHFERVIRKALGA